MAHEEIYRELAEAKVTGEFVAYHKWGDDPSIFLVGRVLELSPTSVTFDDIDTSGQGGDPFTVALRLIHTVDRGTAYLWRLRVLHEWGVSEGEDREVTKRAEVRALLEEAAMEKFVVNIATSAQDDDDYVVLSVGEETAVLGILFDAQPWGGRTVVRLKRITRVRYGKHERNDTAVYRYGLEYGFPNTKSRPSQ